MAKKRSNKGSPRALGTRSRWANPSLARKRQEITSFLPLGGVHPAQLPDDLSLSWLYEPSITRPTAPRSAQVVQATLPKYLSPAVAPVPVAAQKNPSPEKKTFCERRQERREVIFATGKSGGDHKQGVMPSSTEWCK